MTTGNDLKKALPKRTAAKPYERLMGVPTTQALADLIVEHHMAATITAGRSKAQLLPAGDQLLGLEYTNARSAYNRVAALAAGAVSGTLHGTVAGAGIEAAGTYGVVAGDTEVTKAARWICHASGSLGAAHVVPIRDTLTHINTVAVKLDSIAGWRAINFAINIGAAPPANRRGVSIPPLLLPSPESGSHLLEVGAKLVSGFVPANANDWMDLAAALLGIVIRSHGFIDGNGRTGRALFAVALLRGGVPFVAPTVALEQTWHQL